MSGRIVELVCLLALLAGFSQACIHEYGSRQEAQEKAGKHYNYGYNGLDWVNDFEACRGKRQSPLLLPSMGAAAKQLGAPAAKSSFSYGTLVNPVIVNNGHTLQVSLPADFKSDVKIPIRGDKKTATGLSILSGSGPATGTVKATPAQFHFHTHSEHVVNGAEYPLEMHIVHFIKKDQLPACGDAGCPAVLGIMLELTTNELEVKPELRKIINAMPLNEGEKATISGNININNLLPANRTYFTYEGSLTTPPCTEGILWHVLATPIKISQSLLTKYQEAVGDYMCDDGVKKTQAAKAAVAKEGAYVAGNSAGAFQIPANDADGCHKLANGHNFRVVQAWNNRPIKLAVV